MSSIKDPESILSEVIVRVCEGHTPRSLSLFVITLDLSAFMLAFAKERTSLPVLYNEPNLVYYLLRFCREVTR